ncbi:MAG: MBL fold metallo-hydrolase [Puniceicoccales bacterium]
MRASSIEHVAVLPSPAFRLDGGAIFGVVPRVLWARDFPPDADNRIVLTTRVLLASGAGRHLLVDPGIGTAWDETFMARYGIEPEGADFEGSLAQLGLKPESITDVVLTHLHFDHLAGCFRGQPGGLEPVFPNARYHVQRRQWEWAQKPSPKDRASYTPEHLDLLRASGRLELQDGPGELAPGFEVFLCDGHTRAQQLCKLRAGGRSWVYGADVFPLAELLRLSWIMAYDIEPLATVEAKLRCLEACRQDDAFLILGHDTRFLGGQVREGKRHAELLDPVPANAGVEVLYAG